MKLIITSQTSFLERDGQRKFDKNKNKPLQTTYGFTAVTRKKGTRPRPISFATILMPLTLQIACQFHACLLISLGVLFALE